MTHAEYGTLLSYLDGELSEADVSMLESHLAACAGCREEFDDVRLLSDEVSQALGLMPAAPPVARARARLDARIAAERRRSLRFLLPWEFATAGFLKAAAVVLLLASAASAAIPGSPVRRLAAALYDRMTGGSAPAVVEPEVVIASQPEAPTQEPPAATTPMIVRPDAGRLRVSVHRTDAAASVIVRIVDGEGQIRPSAAGPRFRSGEGFVDVYDISQGLLIEIPRSLPGATVEVDGRLIWRKEGASVRAYEPVTEDPSGDFIFRGRS